MNRGARKISLSLWEREGARSAQPSGKGEDSFLPDSALTLPAHPGPMKVLLSWDPCRASVPLAPGEGQ